MVAIRASSPSERAGMMTLTGLLSALDSSAVRTAMRKPSVAARDIWFSLISIRTPCSTGRASSAEAANPTWRIISLKSATFNSTPADRSGTGMGGNSWASMPLMSKLDVPLRMLSDWVRVVRDRLTLSPGRVLIRSAKMRAGTVMLPSSSICAPIQQVIPSSRLVAEMRRRPSSVAIRMLLRTGRVLRGDTALDTTPSPWANCACDTVSFIVRTLL